MSNSIHWVGAILTLGGAMYSGVPRYFVLASFLLIGPVITIASTEICSDCHPPQPVSTSKGQLVLSYQGPSWASNSTRLRAFIPTVIDPMSELKVDHLSSDLLHRGTPLDPSPRTRVCLSGSFETLKNLKMLAKRKSPQVKHFLREGDFSCKPPFLNRRSGSIALLRVSTEDLGPREDDHVAWRRKVVSLRVKSVLKGPLEKIHRRNEPARNGMLIREVQFRKLDCPRSDSKEKNPLIFVCLRGEEGTLEDLSESASQAMGVSVEMKDLRYCRHILANVDCGTL